MSAIQKLKLDWFFFKYNCAKPGAIDYYHKLIRDQARSPEEIEELCWQRTVELVAYAYRHVPFYRDRFDALGLRPEDIRNPEDYQRIPLLTRQDLTTHFDRMLSDQATIRDVRLSTTGGSSGVPAKVYHQKNVIRAATGWRMLGWWGISPADNWASVYRDVRTNFKARVIHALQWFPTRHLLLNATSFTEQDMAKFLAECQKIRPQLIHGYVGAMDVLANYALEHGIEIPPPKAIWVTSAPITAVQQKRIETAFRAPVYDQYGCCEIYWLAAECPARRGLHMFQDIRRFEFLDENGKPLPDGEYGNIVVTDLENRYFPLIRYVNGDRGRRLADRCNCGCNLPLMDKVKGRVSETFKLPSGTRLNGEYMTTLFDDFPEAVRQFQVHQLADGSIRIRVIPNPDYPELAQLLEKVRSKLEVSIRHEVPVGIEEVETIPQRGGKLKFIISDVQ